MVSIVYSSVPFEGDAQIANSVLVDILKSDLYHESIEVGFPIFMQFVLVTFNGIHFDFKLLSFFLLGFSSNYYLPSPVLDYLYINKLSIYGLKVRDKLTIFHHLVNSIINNEYGTRIFQVAYLNKNSRFEGLIHVDLYFLSKEDQKSALSSLNSKKMKIFMDACYQNTNIISPVEFNDLFGQNIEDVKVIQPSQIDLWVEYNLNDCFYTFLLYFQTPAVFDSFESRLLFYKMYDLKDFKFSESFMKTDTQLAITVFSRNVKIEKAQEPVVVKYPDLVILYDYPHVLTQYKGFFESAEYCELKDTFPVEIKEATILYSKGGLHSENPQKVHIIQNVGGVGGSRFYDFDVQSFYVELFIKICETLGMFDVATYVRELGQLRLKYKKEKNKFQKVLKIIILSITGSLNFKFSPIYNPKLYFSITSNGQLFLSEFLFRTSSLIRNVLFVNTDGVCVEIETDKVDPFFENVNLIESEYKFVFDTRKEIKKGYIVNANKMLLIYSEDDEMKLVGFKKNTQLFYPEFLKYLIEKNVYNFDENSIVSHIFGFFENVNIYEKFNWFVFYQKRKNDRFLYFFSTNPQIYCGLNVGGNFFDKGSPISTISFDKNVVASVEVLKPFFDQICLGTYLIKLIESLIVDNFLQKSVDFCNFDYSSLFLEDGELNPKYRTKIIDLAFSFVFVNKFYVFPKNVEKKSFKNQKTASFFKEPDPFLSLKRSLKEFAGFWLRAAALTIDVQNSFPFVCLDFDDISFFYKTNNANLFEFLKKMKANGHLILSSPVYGSIYRFKILLEVRGFKNKVDFEAFMVRVQENYPISYEQLATIYGNHQFGIDLKADDFTKKCICFSKEELEDVFLDSSQTLEKSQQQYIDDMFFLFFHPNFLNDQIMNVRFLKSEKAKFFKYINLTDEKHLRFQHFTLLRFLEFYNMSLDQFYGLVGNLSTLLETYNEKLKSNSKRTLKKLKSDSVPVGEGAPGAIPIDISSNDFNNLFAVFETQDDLSQTLEKSQQQYIDETLENEKPPTENEKTPTNPKQLISSTPPTLPRPRRPRQPAAFMVNKINQTNSEVENLNESGGSKESLVTREESTLLTRNDTSFVDKEPTLLTWNDTSFVDKDKPHEFIDVEYSIIEKDEFRQNDEIEDRQNDEIEDFTKLSDDQLTEKIRELSQKGDPKMLADYLQNIFNKEKNQVYNYKEDMDKERSVQMTTKMLRERFALILEEINKVHGFNFAFYPEKQIVKNKHTLIFHSPCIYDTKEDNNFTVTLYLTKMGCNIHCYHQKCQELGKYKNIENSLRAKLIEINLKEQDSFMESDGSTVAELISKLFRDSNF